MRVTVGNRASQNCHGWTALPCEIVTVGTMLLTCGSVICTFRRSYEHVNKSRSFHDVVRSRQFKPPKACIAAQVCLNCASRRACRVWERVTSATACKCVLLSFGTSWPRPLRLTLTAGRLCRHHLFWLRELLDAAELAQVAHPSETSPLVRTGLEMHRK